MPKLLLPAVAAYLLAAISPGAYAMVLYSNDFSATTTGLTPSYPASLSLVASPFGGSSSLQVAPPPEAGTNYVGPGIQLAGAALTANPIVIQSARLGLAPPAVGTATHGAQAGIEIFDRNLAPIAELLLIWDPDQTVSFGLPLKHVYVAVDSYADSLGNNAGGKSYDLSNAPVESANLTSIGDIAASIVLNYTTGKINFVVNGATLDYVGTFTPSLFDGVGYEVMYASSVYSTSVPRAIFDDYSLIAVPEPTSFAMAVFPLMGFASLRRRGLR